MLRDAAEDLFAFEHPRSCRSPATGRLRLSIAKVKSPLVANEVPASGMAMKPSPSGDLPLSCARLAYGRARVGRRRTNASHFTPEGWVCSPDLAPPGRLVLT